MTTTSSGYFRKFASLLILLVSLDSAVFADDWILAGTEFSLKNSNTGSESLKKAAEVLPQLILEQISSNRTRVIPEGEALDRRLDALQMERLSLFLQLEKEVKARDSLVVTVRNPKKLEREIIKQEEKIGEIQKKIEENLKKVDEEMEKSVPKIGGEAERRRFDPLSAIGSLLPLKFFARNEDDEIVSEDVRLYKNDASSLFSPSGKALETGWRSREMENEAKSAKINGVLSGVISSYGDYAGVTVELFVYPGAKSVGTVTEVGSISDIVPLAKRIVQSLAPKIANSLPVMLKFDIAAAESQESGDGGKELVLENPVVSIDEVVYTDVSRPILLDAGIHTISVEARGFETASVTYSFSGDTTFLVRARLVPSVSGTMKIRLAKMRDGLFYADAIDSDSLGERKNYAELSVNGKDVLGVFEDSATESKAFVFVPFDSVQDGALLKVSAKPFDRAANIDRRRRRMYLAYSALVCSLPFTFYTLGEFTAANSSYAAGRGSYDEAVKWQGRTNVCQGISLALGVWAAVELVRYLWAANRVLPAKAKIDGNPENFFEIEPGVPEAESVGESVEEKSEKVENN